MQRMGLGFVKAGQACKMSLAGWQQAYVDQAAIGLAALAPSQAEFLAVRDRHNHTLVLQLEAFSKLADRGPAAAGAAAEVLKRQALQWCADCAANGRFAEVRELAQRVAEFR